MLDALFQNCIPHRKKLLFIGAVLFILNGYLWAGIVVADTGAVDMYFLPVGEGDSELIVLPGHVKVLIDGGPANGRALEALGAILGPTDRRIDLMVLSHPQLDHYGGLVDIVRRYDVGAFLWNGETSVSEGFRELRNLLSAKHISMTALERGDAFCFEKSCGEILWPAHGYVGDDANDHSLVLLVRSSGMSALFTGDLGSPGEEEILKNFREDIQILKVGHHGSKYSTGRRWLETLRPEIAAIEVGKNSYGHPAPETLGRIAEIGALILRTDAAVLWSVEADGKKLRIFSESR